MSPLLTGILASSSKTATAILSLLIVSTELLTVFVPPTSKMKRCWPIKRGEILYWFVTFLLIICVILSVRGFVRTSEILKSFRKLWVMLILKLPWTSMPKLRRKRRKNLSPTSKEKSRSLEEDFNGKADRSYRPHIRYADRYKKGWGQKTRPSYVVVPVWVRQYRCRVLYKSATNQWYKIMRLSSAYSLSHPHWFEGQNIWQVESNRERPRLKTR